MMWDTPLLQEKQVLGLSEDASGRSGAKSSENDQATLWFAGLVAQNLPVKKPKIQNVVPGARYT